MYFDELLLSRDLIFSIIKAIYQGNFPNLPQKSSSSIRDRRSLRVTLEFSQILSEVIS